MEIIDSKLIFPIYRVVNNLYFVPHSITVGEYMAKFSSLIFKVMSDSQAKIEKVTNFASHFEYCHSGKPFIMRKDQSRKVSWKELLPDIIGYCFDEMIAQKSKPTRLWEDHRVQSYIDSIKGKILAKNSN